jgi:hypothetical protein
MFEHRTSKDCPIKVSTVLFVGKAHQMMVMCMLIQAKEHFYPEFTDMGDANRPRSGYTGSEPTPVMHYQGITEDYTHTDQHYK